MLLYITAEDVFGSGAPERRGPRPLHTIPETLSGLVDLGLRHHVRAAAMTWWADEAFVPVPDWKLDRLAIRMALFGRERLGLEPGERVVVMGRLGWLWPALDFGAMGFGWCRSASSTICPTTRWPSSAAETAPRAAFATDARERRSGSRGCDEPAASGPRPSWARGSASRRGSFPSSRLMDLAAVLDTPERAQAFGRTRARSPRRARRFGTPGRGASRA